MPVPTDTLWNIRRLNWVFAASAVVLVAMIGWTIVQDYGSAWRPRQEQGRAWEAALVDEKISRDLTPEVQKRIAELQKAADAKTKEIETSNAKYKALVAQMNQIDGKRAAAEFDYNTLKANNSVKESQLQDAITARDNATANALAAELAEPRKKAAQGAEDVFKLKTQLADTRAELAKELASATTLKKQLTLLTVDIEGLQKKENALRPTGLIANVSSFVQSMPLMGFVNPANKPKQVVLNDVLTPMNFEHNVPTTDRCITCHVNIAKKEFTEDKILAYLEEQVATARGYTLPDKTSGKATDPSATRSAPGPAALPEFWNAWAVKIAPASLTKNKFRATTLAGTVGTGKPATVTYDGQPLDTFKYDFALNGPEAQKQDAILVALIDAWSRFEKGHAVQVKRGNVTVDIAATTADTAATPARTAALIYAENIQTAMKAALPVEAYKQLLERYRYALVDTLNPYRKRQGLDALSPSPVLLAHPRLDLYVDVDSKHSFEAVGCTSCHDGSGQETHFVLAAHTPKSIWVDEATGQPVLSAQFTQTHEQAERPTLSSMFNAVYPENAAVPEKLTSLTMTVGAEPTTKPTESIAAEPPRDAKPTAFVDPVTGKSGRAVSQMDYWISIYEGDAPRPFSLVYHEWDRPMLPPKYLQASCVRCHNDPAQIREHAPVIYKGRNLFTQLGCANCHQMDSIPTNQKRQVGTDLRQVTSKLSPAYINTWIWAPKAFRPSTKMPHFFMLENNSSDEELRRTRQEARAMTEYLVQTATPQTIKYPISEGLKGDKKAGHDLFTTLGCMACHSNLNENGEDWITTDLVKREGMKADEAKKTYASMSYNERQLYALRNFPVPMTGEPLPTYADKTLRPIFMHLGPELSGIGTKLTAGRSEADARQWLFQWLKEPRHYSDYTIMPRLRLTDQETADLADYLLDQKRTSKSPEDNWTAGLADVDALKIRELTASFLKSRYSVNTAFEKANDDAELLALATDALTTPKCLADVAAVKAKAMPKQEQQLVFLGKKLISNYGCMQCHAINGMETATSPCANLSDWGQKGIDKLAFEYLDHHKVEALPPTAKVQMVNGLSPAAANLGHTLPNGGWANPISQSVEVGWPELEHRRTDWITQKLKNTRVYDRGKVLLDPHRKGVENGVPVLEDTGSPYDKLKMPTFYLDDEEVHELVTFVISNRDRLISDHLLAKTNNEEANRIAQGRFLTEKFNCIGCHQTERNVPAIQRFFKPDDLTKTAPPSLRGEGNKIQHTWLFNFLKNVEKLRPLPAIRMPSFPIADDEATTVAAYFASVSNKEADELHKHLDPVMKYVNKTAVTQPAPLSTIVPESDWYTRREFADAREWLVNEWALPLDKIKPVEIDPTKNSPADLAKSYRTLLFRALFIQDLFKAPYPFVDSPRPEISDARFKLGEDMFYDMKCLSCHIMGDPKAAGALPNPTAPNLGLAFRRLQSRWIRHWVQEPAKIQNNTAMPPFFTGEPVFDLSGQSRPRAQNIPNPERSVFESRYGKTADEQTELLLDFLYSAGVRNYTAVLPAVAPITKYMPAPGTYKEEPEPAPAPAPAPPKPQAEAPAPEPAAAPAKNLVSITGKVLLQGNAPVMPVINMAVAECNAANPNPVSEESVVVNPNGTLKNVVVSISQGLPAGAVYPVPAKEVELNQNGCMYSPHILAMMAGQKLNVRNSDPFMHNVHSLANINPAFNQAQPNRGVMAVSDLKSEENFHVKCDVHGWMGANIAVFEHPFFAVTGDDGTFKIQDLPPGNYKIKAWQERFGEIEQDLLVQQGKPASVDFVYKP